MKNFLIPFIQSDPSESILSYAISIGVKCNAKLIFYHASNHIQDADMEACTRSVRNAYNELKLDFLEFSAEIIVENNIFSNSVLKQLTEKYHIDLVIMGSSQEGLKSTFFGSHVSELLNTLFTPVLTVPHNHPDINIDRIGVATELIDLQQRVTEVVPFAKLFNASVEAFHVYPVFPQTIDIEAYDVKKSLMQVRAANKYDKIDLHFIRTPFDNEPVKGIREFLSVYKPDLLVMCHKPKGILDKLLDGAGTTVSVVKNSSIPILALNMKSECKL